MRNTKTIIVTISLGLIVLGLFFGIKKYTSWVSLSQEVPKETEVKQKDSDASLLGKAVKTDAISPKNQVEENIKFLSDLKETMAKLTDPDQIARAKILYYTRLPNTNLSDGSPEKKKLILESYNGIAEVLGGLSHENPLYMRAASAVWILYSTNCYIDEEFDQSNLAKDPLYVDISKTYKGKVAKFLFISKLFEQVPTYNYDKLVAAQEIVNLAIILDSFESDLVGQDKDHSIERFKASMANFEGYPPSISTLNPEGKPMKNPSAEVWQKAYYSYAYQVLGKFDTTITKEQVLGVYNDALMFVDQEIITTKAMYAVYARNWVLFAYTGYYYEVNGNIVDDLVTKNIETFMSVDSSEFGTKEYLAVENFLFMNVERYGNWDKMKARAIAIAQAYPAWKTYLGGMGLRFDAQ